jgi:hypothetical protein
MSRALFAVGDSLGVVCGGARDATEGSASPAAGSTASPVRTPAQFNVKSLCQATGIDVKRGTTYEVRLTVTEPWHDGYVDPSRPGIAASPTGFGWKEGTATMVPGMLLRRHAGTKWFTVIARVGPTGAEEHPLTFDPTPAAGVGTYRATFTPSVGGELYLFVSDAVIGLPWIADVFYSNNHGKAAVTVNAVGDST